MATKAEPTFNRTGYPSDETLHAIETWPFTDMQGLFRYLKAAWEYPDRFDDSDPDCIKLSTGGWSGNEELIGALQENAMAWALTWQMSQRGGYYEFRIPENQRK